MLVKEVICVVYGLAQRLRDLRETKKLSQEVIATRIGVTKSTISSYETGTISPTLENLTKLAGVYGVTTDYLLGRDNRRVIVLDGLTPCQQDALEAAVETIVKAFGAQ